MAEAAWQALSANEKKEVIAALDDSLCPHIAYKLRVHGLPLKTFVGSGTWTDRLFFTVPDELVEYLRKIEIVD